MARRTVTVNEAADGWIVFAVAVLIADLPPAAAGLHAEAVVTGFIGFAFFNPAACRAAVAIGRVLTGRHASKLETDFVFFAVLIAAAA